LRDAFEPLLRAALRTLCETFQLAGETQPADMDDETFVRLMLDKRAAASKDEAETSKNASAAQTGIEGKAETEAVSPEAKDSLEEDSLEEDSLEEDSLPEGALTGELFPLFEAEQENNEDPGAGWTTAPLETLLASNDKDNDMGQIPTHIPEQDPLPPEPARVSLRNARAKTAYEFVLEGFGDVTLVDDGGSGLALEDGKFVSEGMTAGEYTLNLTGQQEGRDVDIIARLSVIARPQDLWVSLPSDQEAPLAKPDEDSKTVVGKGLLVAASKRGRSHAKEGGYRDDDFALGYDEDSGWHILVVADGAGSAKLSREGSRKVCAVVSEKLPGLLAKNFADVDMAQWSKAWRDNPRSETVLKPFELSLSRVALLAARRLEERAEDLGKKVTDLATTLSIAVAKHTDDGWVLASFSIGDGGVGVWCAEEDNVVLMCQPDSGDYAGQTRFLSMGDLKGDTKDRLFVEMKDTFTAFVAMTDGITDPKFETDAGLASAEKWRAFWHEDLAAAVEFASDNEKMEAQFLEWMDFWSRGNHDDRTLAVMVLEGDK
jgi:hypothetical protein